MLSLPIVLLVLSGGIAGLTQVVKFFGEPATKTAWQAEVPQITAAVIASALSLLAQVHLPLGIGPLLSYAVNQLGVPLTAILLSAGSYFLHDIAAIAQNLLVFLQSKFPAARR